MPTFMLYGEGNAKEQAFCEQSWLIGSRSGELLCCMYGRNRFLEEDPRTIRVDGVEDAISVATARDVDTIVLLSIEQFEAGRLEVFEAAGFRVIGVSRATALLEGSKVLAKQFMERHGVASARSLSFAEAEEAQRFLNDNWKHHRYVVKASCYLDDIAFSCRVPDTLPEAVEAVRGLSGHLESIGAPRDMLLEERVEGREFSVHVLIDGADYQVLPRVRDHKQLLEGDKGPNTAGIGAVAAAGDWDEGLLEDLRARIIEPTMRGLSEEGIDYRFVLYIGVMITQDGPIALEYNVRPGMPEFPALLALAGTSGLDMLAAARDGKIGSLSLKWDEAEPCSVTVTLTTSGYPFSTEGFGEPISGLDQLDDDVWPLMDHLPADQVPTVSGGRVLTLVARGRSFQEARERVYRNADRIRFRGRYFRRDIGDLTVLD